MAEEARRLYRKKLNIADYLELALVRIPSETREVRLGHVHRSVTEAAGVRGDSYDVFETKGGKMVVPMGDVSKPGMGTARTAILMKDALHALARPTVITPSLVLKRYYV